MHAEIAKNEEAIENENQKSTKLTEMIIELEKVKEQKKEAYEQLTSEYLKQKDEPNRLGKQNENLKIQVKHQQSELDGFKAKCEKYQRDHDNEMKQHEKLNQ